MYDINLLPAKLQRKINIDCKRLLLLLVVILVPAGLAGGYTFFLLHLNNMLLEVNRIDRRLEQIAPRAAQVEQLRRERLRGEQQISTLRSLLDNRFTITPILDDIAYNLPVDMWITAISAEYRENPVPRGGFASAPGILAPVREETLPKPDVEPASEPQQENDDDISKQQPGEKQFPPPPNILVLQGVSHSTVSIGVFVDNLSRLPYFQYVDVIKVYTSTSGERGQAFHIEARMREVRRDVPKP